MRPWVHDDRVQQVTRDGLAFDVAVSGPPDGPPVLLLHGFPQRHDSWAGVVERLTAAGYRCIAPDQRGYSPGARPAGRRAYAGAELVADALAVIDSVVGSGEPVHVVGHDWGAVVAWRLAARHPERVRTLTAVSVPPPRAFLGSMLRSRQALASWYMLAFQLPVLPERLVGDPGRFADWLRGSGQSAAAAARDAAAMAERGAATGGLNWYRAMPLEKPAAEPLVRAPTLFVWSDGDVAITPASTDTAHQHVSGPFRFVTLRGVSHWIPDEVPDVLAELIVEQVAVAGRP